MTGRAAATTLFIAASLSTRSVCDVMISPMENYTRFTSELGNDTSLNPLVESRNCESRPQSDASLAKAARAAAKMTRGNASQSAPKNARCLVRDKRRLKSCGRDKLRSGREPQLRIPLDQSAANHPRLIEVGGLPYCARVGDNSSRHFRR